MEKVKLSRSALLFLILCLLASAFISIYLSSANQNYRNQDFFTFWLGARMTLNHQDVYAPALWMGNHTLYGSTWIENSYYVYPLSTALVTTPFGLLNIGLASSLWLFLSMAAIIAGVVLMLTCWQKINWLVYLVPIVLGTFLFRPTFLNLLTGQIDGFLFCLLACAIFLFYRGKNRAACFLLAFLILKPNIGAPILAVLLSYALLKKLWREAGILAGSTLVILLLPLIYDPVWITKYISVGLYKSADNNLFPNLRGLAGLLAHESPLWTNLLWALLCLIVIAGISILLYRRKAQLNWQIVLTFALPLSLLITPYLRAYDLILLLIPILEITHYWAVQGQTFLQTSFTYLGWSLLAFAFLFLAVALQQDILSVGLALLVLIVLSLQFNKNSRSLTIPPS